MHVRLLRTLTLWAVGISLWQGAPQLAWAGDPTFGWWLPPDASAEGWRIDRLFYLILLITGVAFVLVEGALIVFAVKYRRREGRRALYTHGHHMVEVIWTAIPTIILIWLAFHSQHLWDTVRGPAPEDALVVRVTGEQFAWNVQYPGPDGRLDTDDDIVPSLNQMHVPVGRPVSVRLRSKDVIHSFFLPQFRVKQDALPGMETHTWFTPRVEGQYEIACAELCGLGHYRMRGYLTVETPEQFAQWLQETAAQ